MTKLTKRSTELFKLYAEDAPNWSGIPLVGGNVGGSKADRGNITHLKRAGLITTSIDEGNTWINFTTEGAAYAQELGIELDLCYTPKPSTVIATATAAATTEGTKEETMTKTKAAKTTKTPKTTKTAKKAAAKKAPAKKAAAVKTPKAAKAPKTPKAAKATNGTPHAFAPTADQPLVCSVCSEAPSGTQHRRHMDGARRIWRNGTAGEHAAFLSDIKNDDAKLAKLSWTDLPAEIKRALSATITLDAIAKEEAK